MKVALDHGSPVPLFHQIAEALRYRIATGDLKPGTVLPPLRQAARLWAVNLHTVRRAYGELARSGVVVTEAPGGTRVRPGRPGKAGRPGTAAREELLRSIVRAARGHGLSVAELIALLRGVEAAPASATIAVVECSRTQCEDLAAQVESRLRVTAVPWVLDRRKAPPAGLMLGTYFHYNDIRARWPERLPDVRFLPISPEPDLGERLRRFRPRSRRPLPVVLCEKEEEMARNMIADLVHILPPREFRVRTKVVAKAEAGLLGEDAGTSILFSPRMWGDLDARARRDPRAHQLRYLLDPGDLDELAMAQGWEIR